MADREGQEIVSTTMIPEPVSAPPDPPPPYDDFRTSFQRLLEDAHAKPFTATFSGFWDPVAPSPEPPTRRRIEIKLDPRRPAFVTYAVMDETGSFTLTGDEARRYARHFSPKFQARMRRMRSSYRRRWRSRS